MRDRGRRWLLGITIGAAVMRLPGLFVNTFHADEALFASFARTIAVWRDPLLAAQPVDKPPLLFYLQALFYPLFGPVEWAARLPDFIASILLVPLVGLWAWRVYKEEETAVFAALLIALSPLAIQFSATAFTDPLLTLFLTAALATASGAMGGRGRARGSASPFFAGILFGLAAATKHQAWLFWPLLFGLGWLSGWRWPHWRRWLAGFVPPGLSFLLWELARSGGWRLWSIQVANFGGVRSAWSWELWPRGAAWAGLWRQTWGFPFIAALILALLGYAAVHAWRQAERHALRTWLLLLFGAGYLLLHWLLAIPVWDRYLLPLLPPMALAAGYGLSAVCARVGAPLPARRLLSAGLLTLLLLPGAWKARSGGYALGGGPNADLGAAVLAEALAGAPYGAVLYDHWYSWQWRYHLFDKRVYVSWFPHTDALLADLAVFGGDGHSRYIALPDAAVSRPAERALVGAGFSLRPVTLPTPGQINLWEIVPAGGATP